MMKKILTGLFILIIAESLTCFAQDDPMVQVTVKKGDCLIHICNKYLEKPSLWQRIARINNLKNPDVILPGQTLLIPASMMKGTPVPGTVTFLQGNADSKSPDMADWTPLARGDRVEEGQTVRTGRESSMEISFDDGNTFLLRPDTTIGFETARKSGSDYSKYRMSFNMGKLISNIRKSTGKESSVQIEAPTAVLGVRGTVFRSYVLPDGTSRCEVIEGEVTVAGINETVEVGQGEGTIVYRGKAPMAPRKLLQPPALLTEPDSTYKKLPVCLSFAEIADAVSYRIITAKDIAVKNIVIEKVIGTNDIFEIANAEDGIYFLQTNSIDEIGLEGLPSEPVKIHIRVNPLPPFVEIPADRAEYKSRSLRCKWLKVRDADRYRLQIARDPEFRQPVLEQKEFANTEFSTGNLDYGTYFFRISSIASDRYQGEWSDALAFTFVPPPVSPPVETPEVDKDAIKIRWQDLGKDIKYHFQMSKDENFKEILLDATVAAPENTFEKPKRPGIYYVRISGIDSAGREGSFSVPQSFEIKSNRGLYGFLGFTGLLLLLGL